jgi:hypothetical protein
VGDNWNRDNDDEPSYLGAMLKSPLNINLGLTSLAASTFLAIPFGLAGAALPILLFAAGEAIASMFVPSSSLFRNKVDRAFRKKRHDNATEHLCREIGRRVTADNPNWQIWRRICERVESLREIGGNRRNTLSESDVDRIADSSLDFLGLWLAEQSIVERRESVDESAIERRIADIGKRIEQGAADSASLRKARSDLEELLLRHRRIESRLAAVEAALLSLPDAVEEIYQTVVAMPTASEGGTRLQEAIDRLRLEQELESSYSAEVSELVPKSASRMLAAGRQ